MLSFGPATSYDLKQRVGMTVGNFWAFAHSQLYDEPARLVVDGLVSEEVEEGGRRRRTYSVTPEGKEALREWLSSETVEQTEVRDLGLLKLFFSTWGQRGDVLRLARDRHRSHHERAEGYLTQHEQIIDHGDQWQVKSLELGIRYERCVEQFWADFITEIEAEVAEGIGDA